ncbi:MAG: hypothetical protein U0T81_09080 [Saprospiraceae bacterium]
MRFNHFIQKCFIRGLSLVIDKTTPSCGQSRFGCWVCTVVNRDKSMDYLIDNGDDWMRPSRYKRLIGGDKKTIQRNTDKRKGEIEQLKKIIGDHIYLKPGH